MATLKYTLKDFNDIIFNGFNLVLPNDTVESGHEPVLDLDCELQRLLGAFNAPATSFLSEI